MSFRLILILALAACDSGDSGTTPQTQSADLAVAVSGPDSVIVADRASYEIVARNLGPDVARHVTLRATIEGNVSIIGSDGGGVVQGVVEWPVVAEVAPGDSVVVTVAIVPWTVGIVVIRPTATAATPDPDATNNDGSRAERRQIVSVVPDPTPIVEGWVAMTEPPPRTDGSRFDDVFFVDALRGWIASVRGEIWRTTDGGTTWTMTLDSPGTAFRAVGFATTTLGWVGNLNRFTSPTPGVGLWETRDGGLTWSNITERVDGPDPVGICALQVVDGSTIYAVGRWHGPAVFLRSHDAGATWTSFDMEPAVTGLVDVHFFDTDTGLVLGGVGVGSTIAEQQLSRTVILRTTDGGDTWTAVHTSTREGTLGWKFSFPTEQTGYASVQGAASPGIVLKTTDGGLTWNELQVADDVGFSGIGFATPLVGWVGGSTRSWETVDGGETWELVTLGRNLNRFRMESADFGYAVGDRLYRFTGRD